MRISEDNIHPDIVRQWLPQEIRETDSCPWWAAQLWQDHMPWPFYINHGKTHDARERLFRFYRTKEALNRTSLLSLLVARQAQLEAQEQVVQLWQGESEEEMF